MILGAYGSVHAHLVLFRPPTPSGWCTHVPDGAASSVSNPVSNRCARDGPGYAFGELSSAAQVAKKARIGSSSSMATGNS